MCCVLGNVEFTLCRYPPVAVRATFAADVVSAEERLSLKPVSDAESIDPYWTSLSPYQPHSLRMNPGTRSLSSYSTPSTYKQSIPTKIDATKNQARTQAGSVSLDRLLEAPLLGLGEGLAFRFDDRFEVRESLTELIVGIDLRFFSETGFRPPRTMSSS